MHDPELYEARFNGLRYNGFDEPDHYDDGSYAPHCRICADPVAIAIQVTCQDCYKLACKACSFQTGVCDGYRCKECEQRNLEKLERACKLIGSVKYQEQLIDAMMKEIWI
jgi:hypothetical protein